jgi:hypothetical protein
MSSAILEFPTVEELTTTGTDDFELDLRITIHSSLEGELPQMFSVSCGGTCGTCPSEQFSCFGTCTVYNC